MALYIKDPEVDALANELQRLAGAPTKAAAVKAALKSAIARTKDRLPMRERLAKTLAMAREAGPFAPGDHKRDTDELWGED
ncbi:MAG: type II toxin-antitoxin system VapB family antitoxin [Sphingobium sp.]